MDSRAREIEAATHAKFSGTVYQPERISLSAASRGEDYSSRTLALKVALIRRYCTGPVLVDVCCSTGMQLAELASGHRLAVGVDFSLPFLQYGRQHARDSGEWSGAGVCANVRALPFGDRTVDGAYSLSSLYYIPAVAEVIAEVGRVLKPGGRCVLDMGNVHSLNNIVCRAYPDLAELCPVSLADMLAMIDAAGLTILEHRSFQILPMWGDRPAKLKRLLSPKLVRLMARRLGGRTLDEWVSSLPVLRRYAFRQVFVCERTRP